MNYILQSWVNKRKTLKSCLKKNGVKQKSTGLLIIDEECKYLGLRQVILFLINQSNQIHLI